MQTGNIVQVGSSDLFNSQAYTQAGVPHLMQYLWDKYCEHLQEEINRRIESRRATVDLATAKSRAPATNFATWASNYLENNRVVDSFFIDENLGIRLTNGVRLAVCPGIEVRGTMQPVTEIRVTEGADPVQETQQGMRSGKLKI